MSTTTSLARNREAVVQFSAFTQNRTGRLHDLIRALTAKNVHVLALTVLDTTENAIIRFAVDDPDGARQILRAEGVAFTESPLVVVELESAGELGRLMTALLEAEVNINYLYSFIPHPNGRSILGLNIEDTEIAEQILTRHQFNVLRQADISR